MDTRETKLSVSKAEQYYYDEETKTYKPLINDGAIPVRIVNYEESGTGSSNGNMSIKEFGMSDIEMLRQYNETLSKCSIKVIGKTLVVIDMLISFTETTPSGTAIIKIPLLEIDGEDYLIIGAFPANDLSTADPQLIKVEVGASLDEDGEITEYHHLIHTFYSENYKSVQGNTFAMYGVGTLVNFEEYINSMPND